MRYPLPFMKLASVLVILRMITSRGSSLWKKLIFVSALCIPICRSLAVIMS